VDTFYSKDDGFVLFCPFDEFLIVIYKEKMNIFEEISRKTKEILECLVVREIEKFTEVKSAILKTKWDERG
jgi:hypothetical protein